MLRYYLKKKLKFLFKTDKNKKKNKRFYFSKLYKKYNNKIWKQKINWKFRWKIKKIKRNTFKNRFKAFKINKNYLKNKIIKNYLQLASNTSVYYKNKSNRQFLGTFKKIRRRSLSFRRLKRKKLKWYRIKYKQKLVNQSNILLKYNKLKFIINKKHKQNRIYMNFQAKYKLKNYLKNKIKNKKLAVFISKNKIKNKKWKSYWTYLKIFRIKKKWSRKNRVIKYHLKQKFSNYKTIKIKKYLFKQLLQKIIKKHVIQKAFFINKYGIKKNNKAYLKKEKNKKIMLNKKLNYRHYKNNKIFFRKAYSYRVFDNIKKNIKKNYLLSKKMLNFIIKNNTLLHDNKLKCSKLFLKGNQLVKNTVNSKIKLNNLLKIKQHTNNLILSNKQNVYNLLKKNNSVILSKSNYISYALVTKIKNIIPNKFISSNVLKTKFMKDKLKKITFRMKKHLLNKCFYVSKEKNINNYIFKSLLLLKQKKQILYIHNLINSDKLISKKKIIKKENILKKIKLLKKIDKNKLLKYIANKKLINHKINKNMQNINKVEINKKIYLINKLDKLNKQKKKLNYFIAFYKNRLKKKLKWLFRVIKRTNKLRQYNQLLKSKVFKEFIKTKQNTTLTPNKYIFNAKLKLYSYNLSKHIDDNNKWMNYYIRKSFKWKFFKKRWHYRYSKWKRLSYFKKLMKRAKDSYRKLQKNFVFIKLFRANFNNFIGISEEEMLNKWIKLRRGNNHNDNTNIVTRFNQMLQLKLDGLAIFLGLAPSRFLAQELIKCGGLRINGTVITNINHFISLNNILQIDLQIKEDLKLFYSFNHWLKVKTRLIHVGFLQVMWPMMMFMLIRWPYNYELYEDSLLTSRWIRFFIRYFPIRISKYKQSKVKWYKY